MALYPIFLNFPTILFECSDIVEYNILGGTKAAILRCIPFISKFKIGDKLPNGQYLKYQNFPILRIKKFLEYYFLSIRLELRREIKAAVAERAIRSLKNIIYRYTEENGHKYLVKMSKFLNTRNRTRKRSTGKALKEVKKYFLSFF